MQIFWEKAPNTSGAKLQLHSATSKYCQIWLKLGSFHFYAKCHYHRTIFFKSWGTRITLTYGHRNFEKNQKNPNKSKFCGVGGGGGGRHGGEFFFLEIFSKN